MAKLKGILKKEQIDALKSGVEIDEGITVSAKRVKLKKVDLKNKIVYTENAKDLIL